MPEPIINLIAHDLTEAQGALVRGTQSLLGLPDIVANKVLHELLTANEALTRALKILVKDSETSTPAIITGTPDSTIDASRMELLEQLKRPVSDLQLDSRGSNICSHFPLLILRNGMPFRVKYGFSLLGEIAQLSSDDFLNVRNCGMKTLNHITSKLEEFGVKLGTKLSNAELVHTNLERITSGENIDYNGAVRQFAYGDHAIDLGATDIINRRIDSFSDIDYENLVRFTSIIIRGDDITERPLTTVGELIQISMYKAGHGLPIDPSSILNHLLPKGLCLGMHLNDEILTELGISRIEFVRYNYTRF